MKIETRVKEDTSESRERVNKVMAEVDALRNKLDIRSDDIGVKEDNSLVISLYDVQQEFSEFKSEVNLSLMKLERDCNKIGEVVVEASIIDMIKNYISTEVLEETTKPI